uniref:Uncharacterized protein n=1 Tax=Nelumbo nucifera TaxID=4432 RepID=A0A822YRX1_NELNU|nr:TPA_asm: hypothetical protein HUJ06_004961 [Nelumbo nucifera]
MTGKTCQSCRFQVTPDETEELICVATGHPHSELKSRPEAEEVPPGPDTMACQLSRLVIHSKTSIGVH